MGLIDDDKLIEKSYEISKSGKMTNTGYEILYNTFFQNGNMNHLEECNSVNYHAITHEDTEILGAFCDVTGFHGNDLQKLLILGYMSW